jgi:hypothetical protein
MFIIIIIIIIIMFIIIIIIIIVVIVRYGCLLSHAFSSRYFSWTSSEPHRSGFKLHAASHCSTFRIMCDVTSIAVFCSETIECFPGTAFIIIIIIIIILRHYATS